MSRLDELIRELCPNGVEYIALGKLGKFFGGLTGKSKSDFTDGNAAFITYRNVYANPALNTTPTEKVKIAAGENQRTLEYGDVIFTGSSETPDECGISSVVTMKPHEALYLNSFCFIFRFDDLSIVEPDYAKHLFRSTELRYQIGKTASGVTRFNVSKEKMAKVVIPIPPIEVQREIVRILDKFTELSAELSAGLSARLKQYEFYRTRLLFCNIDIPRMRIDNVCNLHYGKGNKIPQNGGKYPVYGCKGIVGSTDIYNSEDAPIVGHIGSAGSVTWGAGKHYVTYNGTICTPHPNLVLSRYLYHILLCLYLEEKVKGNQPFLSTSDFSHIEIPVPSLGIQKKLVSILDCFDTLCNDLSAGLPAEIEARQKQYEYYRDKLLTFKPLEQ